MKTALIMLLALFCSATHSGEKKDYVSIIGAADRFPETLIAKYKDHSPGKATLFYATMNNVFIGTHILLGNAQCGFLNIPYPDDDPQMKRLNQPTLHLPIGVKPMAIAFNVPGIKELNIDGDTLAKIYLGSITKWNDSKLVALNLGVNLPDMPIIPYYREGMDYDDSYALTHYLSAVSPEWKKKCGAGPSVKFPVGKKGAGDKASDDEGAIACVELHRLKKNGRLENMGVCRIANKAGKFVAPSLAGATSAAQESLKALNADVRTPVINAPGDASYPICAMGYFFVCRDLSTIEKRNHAETLVDFLDWCLTEPGQALTAPTYAPLPADLRKKTREQVKSIQYKGAALLK